ncbi:hypothetical protein D3C75_919150 [compost metagenome]
MGFYSYKQTITYLYGVWVYKYYENTARRSKRKVPECAPLDFVTNRWQKHVFDEDGTINRHYYEMAALTELRNYVRSGDVSIVGSRLNQELQ